MLDIDVRHPLEFASVQAAEATGAAQTACLAPGRWTDCPGRCRALHSGITVGDTPLHGSLHQHVEREMALVPLATKGNFFHVYDFRVKPGRGNDFIDLFNKFDYGDNNPFHRSSAQVKDGVLCRDAADPDHFYLIGEWRDIDEHRRIREAVAREIRPEFVTLIEGGHFVPNYAEIVSMTPQEVLDQAQQA